MTHTINLDDVKEQVAKINSLITNANYVLNEHNGKYNVILETCHEDLRLKDLVPLDELYSVNEYLINELSNLKSVTLNTIYFKSFSSALKGCIQHRIFSLPKKRPLKMFGETVYLWSLKMEIK